MSLGLAKGYVRFDSSHILICDSEGRLHPELLKTEKPVTKKTKYSLASASIKLGFHSNYLSRICGAGEEDPFYKYLKELNEDIEEAVLMHKKNRIALRNSVLKMKKELTGKENLYDFCALMIDRGEYSSNREFMNLLSSCEKEELPFKRFTQYRRVTKIIDHYREFRDE